MVSSDKKLCFIWITFLFYYSEAKELRFQFEWTTTPFIHNCKTKLVNQTTADHWLLLILSDSSRLLLTPLDSFQLLLTPLINYYQSDRSLLIMWSEVYLTDHPAMSYYLRMGLATKFTIKMQFCLYSNFFTKTDLLLKIIFALESYHKRLSKLI